MKGTGCRILFRFIVKKFKEKTMKKMCFVLIGVVVFMLALSCASAGEGVEEEVKEFTQEDANSAFEKIYNTFRGDLILEGAKTYTVVKGDTLSAITRSNYGGSNGYYFPLIMLASSDVVLDPDLIEPGMGLTIPDLQKNLNDAAARGHLKNFLNEIAVVYEKKGREEVKERLKVLAASL
jgi:hypothetical protein